MSGLVFAIALQKLAPDVEFCIPAVRSKILIEPKKLGGG